MSRRTVSGISIGGVAFMALASAVGSGCGVRAWGEQAAAGPVFGYAPSRGFSFGWEAGGGAVGRTAGLTTSFNSAADYNFLLRGNVGMSWRPARREHGLVKQEGRERLAYAAWEPWYRVLGGTLGYAHLSQSSPQSAPQSSWVPLTGGWAGLALPSDTVSCRPCYTMSVALGWRWTGSGEFYLAPKIGVLHDVSFSGGD